MHAFTLNDLNFIRKHWQTDMSAFQLAHYFGVSELEIHRLRKLMGLKYNLGQLTAFHTPYPFEVAKNIPKGCKPQEPEEATTSCS